ncbi:chemotaxis-related protein WspD [Duganella sp. 1224]|uniref:chemotaxis protein CheW n=1 Tax=Duganella sp. 1224 TaxID=2587052 RepID=UPI0015C7892A|nr:chemotaxis protein CheW [Duganella sp. 1224]NYE61205.1 chemotaxis-related protein WspD [Duganella sp. 1224]
MSTTTSPAAIDVQDCWNVIGVNGDQSCDKLQQHVHCRNCGVYANAAQQNLARPVSVDYKQEWAAHFRQAAASGQQQDASCLVFRIGREWLSLPVRMFVSVAPIAKPHRLPHRASRGLRGIVNVGGTLYPCMSLADLLGIDDTEGEAATHRHTFARLLLTQWEDQAYALPVADLHGILRYASGSVQAPAATINKGLSRFLTGVITHDDMRIGVLDETLIGYQLARTLR